MFYNYILQHSYWNPAGSAVCMGEVPGGGEQKKRVISGGDNPFGHSFV